MSIDLPSTLKNIKKFAFTRCSSLSCIEIPSSVEEIGEGVFADSKVKSVVFTAELKLKKIGKEAFRKCVVETICIPSSVETIENFSFKDCHQLTSVLIESASKLNRVSPKGVTTSESLNILLLSSLSLTVMRT